jgi:TRAP-type C4-dicarboxylate transport system permease small subunit
MISAALLATMVAAIFIQVMARYVFDNALSWPEELGRFVFAWIVFLAAASVTRDDQMLSLELLYRWIPEKWGQALKLLVSTVCFLLLIIVFKGGYELTLRQSSQISTALEIPMWIVYMGIPAGTLFMALAVLLRIGALFHTLFFSARGDDRGADAS